jgi:hypothetical protein
MSLSLKVAGLALLSASALMAAAAPARAVEPDAPVVKVQACGWYSIMTCVTDPGAARRWSARYGTGYVIDTSSNAYPNFRPGFFCVVNGPFGRSQALQDADANRDIAPTAYAKSAC